MAAVVVGSRASHLARAMVEDVLSALRRHHPEVRWTRTTIATAGDRDRTSSLADLRQRSSGAVFASAVEDALLAGRIDIAVHSLKDLPPRPTPGTLIAAVPARADAREALCGATLQQLPPGARVGTGAARRIAQLRALRPDLVCVPIRGNVPPRLRQRREKQLHAVMLAAAGLQRLGLTDEITQYLDPRTFLPSPAQGTVAVQVRADDTCCRDLVARTHDPATAAEATAERALLAALDGDCSAPVGALATRNIGSATLHLTAQVTTPDGRRTLHTRDSAPAAEAELLGQRAAAALCDQGADDILNAADAPPTR